MIPVGEYPNRPPICIFFSPLLGPFHHNRPSSATPVRQTEW
jgi:hypothetical protein